MFESFSLLECFSAFIVLFAIIDPVGAIPVIVSIRQKGREISSIRAVLFSYGLLLLFFFMGNWLLSLFGVDINSFAVAGALVIFLIALEMVLDIEIFKYSGPMKDATYVPLVFPLIAGAGSFTTLLSLKAEYASLNILVALTVNLLIVYIILRATHRIENFFGVAGIYFLRKFFGIILLAISVRLFTSNLSHLIHSIANFGG